jgi:hypothetical protein
MERREHAARRREQGSALFLAVMMLVLMGFLGLAALDRVTRDEQVAGFQNRARTAFYAAEAAFHKALAQMMVDGLPIKEDPVSVVETGYPRVQANAIIEAVGATHPRDYRVYARGVAGPMPCVNRTATPYRPITITTANTTRQKVSLIFISHPRSASLPFHWLPPRPLLHGDA